MLEIVIKGIELFNEQDNSFSNTEDVVVQLEHSLVSLSKWESKHQTPFLSEEPKSFAETMDYIKCMVLSTKPESSLDVIDHCTSQNVDEIQAYMDSSQSATTFGTMPGKTGPSEVITSELIHYWMITFTIPPEYATWHLNRLFALIRICNIKNQPQKKMSKHELAMRNRELNAKRRQELGTKG